MSYDQLCASVATNAARFQRALDAAADTDTIDYTGWAMSIDQLRTHSHSEAAMHRWDLVGDDDTSRRLLSEPRLTRHVLDVFTAIPDLAEARRWAPDPALTSRPLRLRAPDQPDVLVEPGLGLSLVEPSDGDPLVEMDAPDRLLLLWGRCPPALRRPVGNPEPVDELPSRLAS